LNETVQNTFVLKSFLAAGLLTLVAGCEPAQRNQAAKQASEGSDHTPVGESKIQFPLTLTDGLGRKVTLKSAPQRIVCIAPKATEQLFAIGAGDKVVGVTTFCKFPPEATKRTVVGGFSPKSLSLEKIVALHPDMVLTTGRIHASIIEEIARLGIPAIALKGESFEDLDTELQLLGRLTNCERQAARLADQIRKRVAAVVEKGRKVPAKQRVTVFYQAWDDPLAAASPTSYIGRMIEMCGGVNIVKNTSAQYPQISDEIVLGGNPDVILATSKGVKEVTLANLRSRTGWNKLKAVQNGRLYLIEGELILRCGPRLIDALEQMSQALYPNPSVQATQATRE
jgi:iron complex transport system substrate-binding protein